MSFAVINEAPTSRAVNDAPSIAVNINTFTQVATGGAPVDAKYFVQSSDPTLTNEWTIQQGVGIDLSLNPGSRTLTVNNDDGGTQAVADHVADTDPHGDRAYADSITPPPAPAVYIPDLVDLTGGGRRNVHDYGATFSTSGSVAQDGAFLAAIAAAGNAGGGVVEYGPRAYLFNSNLGTLPPNVSLVGTHEGSNSHSSTYDSPWQAGHDLAPTAGGSTFLITETTGGATGTPFVTLATNCKFKYTCLHYPNQSTASSTPTAYPWAIKIGASNDAEVVGVELSLAYQGIWCEWAFRNTIRDVRGNVLSQGIRCEGGADVTRLENVHFGPWRTFGTTLDTWVKANLTAFSLGRNDLFQWRSCFVYGANIGINLYLDTAHNLNIGYTSACWGDFSGGGLDVCNTCIQIAATQPEPCTFRGMHLTTVGGRCLDVVSGYTGISEFANCFWYSSTGQQIRVRGAGRVNIIGGYFSSSLNSNSLAPASPAGSACDLGGTGVAKVVGADFADTQTHVTLASGLTKATVVGNTCSPGVTFTVSNSMSGGTYAVANNI